MTTLPHPVYVPTIHDTREAIFVTWLVNTKGTLDALAATVARTGEGANVSESAAVAGCAAVVLGNTREILWDLPKSRVMRPKHRRCQIALEKLVSDTLTNDPRLDLQAGDPALWVRGLGLCIAAVHHNLHDKTAPELRDSSLRAWIDFDQKRHKVYRS